MSRRDLTLLALVALAGCGDDAIRGAPPPMDLPVAHHAATTAPTPATGTDPTGTDPTGTDPSGTDPTGTDQTGTDQTGTDPTGTDPTGAEAPANEEATPPDPAHPERSFQVRPEQENAFEAYACMGRGDYACVERLLGESRAANAREVGLLIRAQRAAGHSEAACASMQSLFDRFPESMETARYRAVHWSTCPH